MNIENKNWETRTIGRKDQSNSNAMTKPNTAYTISTERRNQKYKSSSQERNNSAGNNFTD
jgi:hypothetical protein